MTSVEYKISATDNHLASSMHVSVLVKPFFSTKWTLSLGWIEVRDKRNLNNETAWVCTSKTAMLVRSIGCEEPIGREGVNLRRLHGGKVSKWAV
jgi:hypothetical protein